MTDARNVPALGEPVTTVDVKAPTFARALKTAQADAFGVLDLITQEFDGVDIDHRGGGRGALMGMPTSIAMGFALRLSTSVGKHGGVDSQNIFFPFFHVTSRGEDTLVVDVVFSGSAGPEASGMRVRDLASLEEYWVRDTDRIAVNTYRATLPIASGKGARPLAVIFFGTPRNPIITDTPSAYIDEVIEGVMVHHGRVGPPVAVQRGTGVQVRVPAPGASAAHAFNILQESMFAAGDAMTGFHVTSIDGNLNALEEYQTGLPAGGNAAYVHTESAEANPTVSRFRAFTRKTETDERIPTIPVGSWAFGGIKEDGGCLAGTSGAVAATPTQGSLSGFAPYPTAGTKTTVGRVRVMIPDAPTGSPGGLLWAAILGKHVTGSNWADTTCGAKVGASAEVEDNFGVAVIGSGLQAPAIAVNGPNLPFATRDTAQNIEINLTHTGSFALGDHSLLAFVVWVDGTE